MGTLGGMKTLYTAVVTTKGGRGGYAEASDGKFKFNLGFPPELGGKGEGTNPEQLFAAGYGACFGSAIEGEAKKKKVSVGEIWVTPHVSIGKTPEGGFQLAVAMHVRLPGVPRATAEEIVGAAHQSCPYSKATRNNVEVALIVDD
jgi:osmotically inducible protein OsmC